MKRVGLIIGTFINASFFTYSSTAVELKSEVKEMLDECVKYMPRSTYMNFYYNEELVSAHTPQYRTLTELFNKANIDSKKAQEDAQQKIKKLNDSVSKRIGDKQPDESTVNEYNRSIDAIGAAYKSSKESIERTFAQAQDEQVREIKFLIDSMIKAVIEYLKNSYAGDVANNGGQVYISIINSPKVYFSDPKCEKYFNLTDILIKQLDGSSSATGSESRRRNRGGSRR